MSNQIDFLTPRFVGARFEKHSLPLEILRDLSVFQELVTETAKWIYLKEHPERQRIPKGFLDGITIGLTAIEPGSVKPKMILVMATALLGLFPPENQAYFEKARDVIVTTIDAAEKNKENITDHLPENLLNYFDRMGRSLLDDECIEFRPENSANPAKLNKETRKALIFASSKARDYSEEIDLVGTVPEADQDKNSFSLLLVDNQKITAPLEVITRDIILEAFNQYSKNQKIEIKGVGRFNRDGKLVRIESIEHVQNLDDLDVPTRLDELSKLSDDWLDGTGKAPDPQGLQWLGNTFNANLDSRLPLPYLYPTAAGGIQAEWSINDWEVSLEIDLIQKSGEYQALNIETDEVQDFRYNLSKNEDWRAINNNLRKLKENQA